MSIDKIEVNDLVWFRLGLVFDIREGRVAEINEEGLTLKVIGTFSGIPYIIDVAQVTNVFKDRGDDESIPTVE
jgi:hypothetical protein